MYFKYVDSNYNSVIRKKHISTIFLVGYKILALKQLFLNDFVQFPNYQFFGYQDVEFEVSHPTAWSDYIRIFMLTWF